MQKPFSANVKAPQELSRAMAVGILDLAIIGKLGNQMNRFAPQLTSTTIRPMNPDSNRRDKKTLLPVAPLPQSDALGSRVSPEQLEQSRRMALAAVKAAAENRGQDIILLDLTEQTALFDFFVIATGSSRRQLAAMSSEIDRVLKYDLHERKMSVSGYEESRWIVLDYGSIVVHLFDEETREFYDLESLWADGKEVNISAIVAEASAQMARLSD